MSGDACFRRKVRLQREGRFEVPETPLKASESNTIWPGIGCVCPPINKGLSECIHRVHWPRLGPDSRRKHNRPLVIYEVPIEDGKSTACEVNELAHLLFKLSDIKNSLVSFGDLEQKHINRKVESIKAEIIKTFVEGNPSPESVANIVLKIRQIQSELNLIKAAFIKTNREKSSKLKICKSYRDYDVENKFNQLKHFTRRKCKIFGVSKTSENSAGQKKERNLIKHFSRTVSAATLEKSRNYPAKIKGNRKTYTQKFFTKTFRRKLESNENDQQDTRKKKEQKNCETPVGSNGKCVICKSDQCSCKFPSEPTLAYCIRSSVKNRKNRKIRLKDSNLNVSGKETEKAEHISTLTINSDRINKTFVEPANERRICHKQSPVKVSNCELFETENVTLDFLRKDSLEIQQNGRSNKSTGYTVSRSKSCEKFLKRKAISDFSLKDVICANKGNKPTSSVYNCCLQKLKIDEPMYSLSSIQFQENNGIFENESQRLKSKGYNYESNEEVFETQRSSSNVKVSEEESISESSPRKSSSGKGCTRDSFDSIKSSTTLFSCTQTESNDIKSDVNGPSKLDAATSCEKLFFNPNDSENIAEGERYIKSVKILVEDNLNCDNVKETNRKNGSTVVDFEMQTDVETNPETDFQLTKMHVVYSKTHIKLILPGWVEVDMNIPAQNPIVLDTSPKILYQKELNDGLAVTTYKMEKDGTVHFTLAYSTEGGQLDENDGNKRLPQDIVNRLNNVKDVWVNSARKLYDCLQEFYAPTC